MGMWMSGWMCGWWSVGYWVCVVYDCGMFLFVGLMGCILCKVFFGCNIVYIFVCCEGGGVVWCVVGIVYCVVCLCGVGCKFVGSDVW